MATDELAKKMFHATSFLLWYSDNHVPRFSTVAVAEVLEAASHLHYIAFLHQGRLDHFSMALHGNPKEIFSQSTAHHRAHIMFLYILHLLLFFSFIQEGELEYIFPHGAVITSGRALRGREPSSRMGDETCRRLGNKVSLFKAITLPKREMS